MAEIGTLDPDDRRLAHRGEGVLRSLNEAGVLEAPDVHVARRLGVLGGEADPEVLLGVALAVRAVRNGSVCVDLSDVHRLETDVAWPVPEGWVAAVAASPLVSAGVVHLLGPMLYLSRYWAEESQVVADLTTRDGSGAPPVESAALEEALTRYFPGEVFDGQREAARLACQRWTSVVTGGPGTGKTTTIARLLGVLLCTEGARPLRVALAAPTGKAAARMAQAVREATDPPTVEGLPAFPGTDAEADDPAALRRDRIRTLEGSTLHRLLGWRSDSSTRFRHDRGNRLPYDVVVVDETSMVSLTLMARLLEAMRPEARLVLVGDADQLASVEAGAVLGDVVRGWSGSGPVARLDRTHRYGRNIAALAEAVNAGDADRVVELLQEGAGGTPADGRLLWLDGDPEEHPGLDALLAGHVTAVREAALRGDGAEALRRYEAHRVLCAHRDGPFGVSHWNARVERLLTEATGLDRLDEWYAGRPVVVNSNDRGLNLWNGDTAVTCVERTDAGPRLVGVVGDGTGAGRRLATTRLADVSTAHAMTVHRSQGSQFDEVTVVLPEPESRILTRELLYTAVTRARSVVRLVGSEEALRAAVGRPAQRATGLRVRLRG
ncbi:MAG TPA: exodeoxyribonuclease V subunit alpha [Marmoricola sp.]|nr:exodeoxyribonuclease V subunit alpha [Marmoricola sp.]